jgi:release factor glutamine methyltransferase
MRYEELWHSLSDIYDEREARAVVRYLLETAFGLSMTDVLGGALEKWDQSRQQLLSDKMQRLQAGEPVQYVVGWADFGPRQFRVAPGVLIPRPETYELCQWMVQDAHQRKSERQHAEMLDIGTGSGCIACTLAAELPWAQVTAWDISPVALRQAAENARLLKAEVTFEERDMLQVGYGSDAGRWDAIVSNPPYICDSEADEMTAQVLEHEPEIALFVPDDDPMLFYLPISNYAQSALREGGRLYFEINPRYDEQIEDILLGLGFDDIVKREDQFGRTRFIRATWH